MNWQTKFAALLVMVMMSCSMGSQLQCANRVMSLEMLFSFCNLPSSCDAAAPWAGSQVSIEGKIDPVNIFDKQHYPQLPYEKFKLHDGKGRSVEVWAMADDNRPIFEKLTRRKTDNVVVRGRLEAVKAPVMGECNLGVRIVINDAQEIEFKKG
ncbi:MAG: hypothetical protein GY874_10655 [Desulfobacteraceae bacterium]|nr:hypothetical protein [Desulfobacteraceae bacterium]